MFFLIKSENWDPRERCFIREPEPLYFPFLVDHCFSPFRGVAHFFLQGVFS